MKVFKVCVRKISLELLWRIWDHETEHQYSCGFYPKYTNARRRQIQIEENLGHSALYCALKLLLQCVALCALEVLHNVLHCVTGSDLRCPWHKGIQGLRGQRLLFIARVLDQNVCKANAIFDADESGGIGHLLSLFVFPLSFLAPSEREGETGEGVWKQTREMTLTNSRIT